MIETSIYQENNLLYIAFKGHVRKVQVAELLQSLPSAYQCLQPDFILLNDFSDVDKVDFACCELIADMMDLMVKTGVGQVIRVMPDKKKDVGCGIMAAFHYPASLPLQEFKDLAETKYQTVIYSTKPLTEDEVAGCPK